MDEDGETEICERYACRVVGRCVHACGQPERFLFHIVLSKWLSSNLWVQTEITSSCDRFDLAKIVENDA